MEDYRAYSASEKQMPNIRSDAHNFFIVLPNLNYERKDVEYINGVSGLQFFMLRLGKIFG